jgi:hypothetical protein
MVMKNYTVIVTPFNALFDAHYERPAGAAR